MKNSQNALWLRYVLYVMRTAIFRIIRHCCQAESQIAVYYKWKKGRRGATITTTRNFCLTFWVVDRSTCSWRMIAYYGISEWGIVEAIGGDKMPERIRHRRAQVEGWTPNERIPFWPRKITAARTKSFVFVSSDRRVSFLGPAVATCRWTICVHFTPHSVDVSVYFLSDPHHRCGNCSYNHPPRTLMYVQCYSVHFSPLSFAAREGSTIILLFTVFFLFTQTVENNINQMYRYSLMSMTPSYNIIIHLGYEVSADGLWKRYCSSRGPK